MSTPTYTCTACGETVATFNQADHMDAKHMARMYMIDPREWVTDLLEHAMFTLIDSSADVTERFLVECGMFAAMAAALVAEARETGYERVVYANATFTVRLRDGEFWTTVNPRLGLPPVR